MDTFQFDLTGNRRRIAANDHLLEDRVADNTTEHDPTESESLLIGRDFGSAPTSSAARTGNLFVVSLTKGASLEVVIRR